jgi:hypothetical protein
MKPFAAKIWIVGRCALHTNTADALTRIVPKCVFPEPEKRRSTRPPTAGNAGPVEVDVDFAGREPSCVECVVLEPVPCAAAAPCVAVLVEPAL